MNQVKTTLGLPAAGGTLLVAGSYVSKTTAQLAQLEARCTLRKIEVDVARVLKDADRSAVIREAITAMNAALSGQKDVLLCTSRALVTGSDAASSLGIGARISAALVEIVSGLEARSRCVITKGGITSSDMATKAFGTRSASALGPIAPGVPVWRLAGLILVVFPGNVGDENALADVVEKINDAR